MSAARVLKALQGCPQSVPSIMKELKLTKTQTRRAIASLLAKGAIVNDPLSVHIKGKLHYSVYKAKSDT